MERIRDDLDEIKDMLRDGAIVHSELKLRVDSIEKWRVRTDVWGWKQSISRELVGLAFDAVKWIAILAYAAHLAQVKGIFTQ